MSTGKYEKIDITFAWNFQQGAMLQWNPKSPENEVIYNNKGQIKDKNKNLNK